MVHETMPGWGLGKVCLRTCENKEQCGDDGKNALTGGARASHPFAPYVSFPLHHPPADTAKLPTQPVLEC
jgi:hypothetical protein